MADLLQVGGLILDPDTGEIVEWEGEPDGPRRMAALVDRHLEAKAQEKRWGVIKSGLSQVLARVAEDLAERKIETSAGMLTRVAPGVIRKAPADAVKTARDAELISHNEAAELLLRAAKELDRDEVERWINEQPEPRQKSLHALLIRETPRKGYVLTAEPARIVETAARTAS